jgi:hypothetical protein
MKNGKTKDHTETPRTDFAEAAWSREYERSRECGWPSIGNVVDSDFARDLERELAKLREVSEGLLYYAKEWLGQQEYNMRGYEHWLDSERKEIQDADFLLSSNIEI